MKIAVLADADAVAQKAAAIIAGEARAAVAARGRFIVAVSGGHIPWQMLRALADGEVPPRRAYISWKESNLIGEIHARREDCLMTDICITSQACYCAMAGVERESLNTTTRIGNVV